MIPVRDASGLEKVPFVTGAVIASTFLLWLYQESAMVNLNQLRYDYCLVPLNLIRQLNSGTWEWTDLFSRFFGSLFLHTWFGHAGWNMYFLWLFGSKLECRLGHLGFLAFYLLSALCGFIAHLAWYADSGAPTLGASGAVSGVIAGYLVAYPHGKMECIYWGGRKVFSSWIFAGVYFAGTIVSDIVRAGFGAMPGGGSVRVSHSSHVGGAIGGAGLVGLFLFVHDRFLKHGKSVEVP